MSTVNRTKVNANIILNEMDKVLAKYRAGLLSATDARQEVAILKDMHRVYESAVLDERIASLEAVLDGRKNGR